MLSASTAQFGYSFQFLVSCLGLVEVLHFTSFPLRQILSVSPSHHGDCFLCFVFFVFVCAFSTQRLNVLIFCFLTTNIVVSRGRSRWCPAYVESEQVLLNTSEVTRQKCRTCLLVMAAHQRSDVSSSGPLGAWPEVGMPGRAAR